MSEIFSYEEWCDKVLEMINKVKELDSQFRALEIISSPCLSNPEVSWREFECSKTMNRIAILVNRAKELRTRIKKLHEMGENLKERKDSYDRLMAKLFGLSVDLRVIIDIGQEILAETEKILDP